ncbi:hypothetical protein BC834DRAFT_548556 [Gloeopeniophorella convolvens]|nr:hypothetical protein BC834DRAFT_548556 [Gloeopeniophorella convolvens]
MDVEPKSGNPDAVKTQANSNAPNADVPSRMSLDSPRPPDTTVPEFAEGSWAPSSSTRMWSLYLDEAERHDTRLATRWKEQLDGIFIFSGFSSVAVSVFVLEGLSTLTPSSTDVLLAHLSLQLAASNNATTAAALPLPGRRESDIAATLLWSLSLILSLGCAVFSSLAQHSIQDYLRDSHAHASPPTRARIRAYMFAGLTAHRMDQAVGAIPLLLHLSVLLFISGLVTYLFPRSHTTALAVLALGAAGAVVYIIATILPIIRLSSPFRTPLSIILRRALHLVRLTSLCITKFFVSLVASESTLALFRLPKLINASRERYRGGLLRAYEDELAHAHPKSDANALEWALSSLHSDTAFESFVAAVPGFLAAEPHTYPQYTIGHLLEDPHVRLGRRIGQLLLTCPSTSPTLPPPTMMTIRTLTCLDAVWRTTAALADTSSLYWDRLFGPETAAALGPLRTGADPRVRLAAHCTTALGTRACLRELGALSPHTAYGAARTRELLAYLRALAPRALPEAPEAVARDGPLLAFGELLAAVGASGLAVDTMAVETAHLLARDVPGAASRGAQHAFAVRVCEPGVLESCARPLGPAVLRVVRRAVAALPDGADLPAGLAERLPALEKSADADEGDVFADARRATAASYSYGSSATAYSPVAGHDDFSVPIRAVLPLEAGPEAGFEAGPTYQAARDAHRMV